MSSKKGQDQLESVGEGVLTSLKPIEKSLQDSAIQPVSLEKITAVKELLPMRSIQKTDQTEDGYPDLNTSEFFHSMILKSQPELQEIARQVERGLIDEDQAEEELILLALTHSINMPHHLAVKAIPSIKGQIKEDLELKEGLHSLWRSQPPNNNL